MVQLMAVQRDNEASRTPVTGVSVVMPVFNGQDEIEEAVRSAATQSGCNVEIIVIDDGSSDETVAVVQGLQREFPDSVRLLQQANGGPAAARNRGIREARFGWIAFLDHDDVWLPDKLRKQLAAAETQNADLVICANHNINASSAYADVREVPDNRTLEGAFEKLLFENFVTLSTVLVRRECLIDAGLFDENWRGVEDWAMWLKLAGNQVRFSSVPEPLVNYLYRTNSLSRRQDDMQRQRRKLLHSVLNSEAAASVSSSVRCRALASERLHSGWAMKSASRSKAAVLFLQSLLYWPFRTAPWKELLKCCIGRA